MSKELKSRNAYLDLLKVVGIFLVVMFHIYDNIFINDKYNNVIDFFTYIFKYLSGNTGNVIFITISAYYLIKSKGPKLNKIIFLMLIQTVTAALMLIVIQCFKIDIVNIHWLKRTLFPFFAGETYWYINTYIIYYALHGYLNKLVENINKNEHKILIIVGMIYYMIFPLIFKKSLLNLTFITNFILIHFIVAYVEKYMKDFNFKKSSLILSILYSIVLVLAFVVDIFLKTNKYKTKMNLDTTKFFNIFLVLLIVSIVFNNKNIKMKQSLIVSKIANLSLYIYLIHDYNTSKIKITSDIFEKYVWDYLDGRYSYVVDRLIYFGAAILYFIANVILAYIYKLLISPILNSLSERISDIISKKRIKFNEKYDKNDK